MYPAGNFLRKFILDCASIYFPYLLISGILFGVVVAFVLQRIDLLIRGFIVIIPALLTIYLLYRFRASHPQSEGYEDIISLPIAINQKILFLLYVVLFSISIILLRFSFIRPDLYFVILALIFGIICVQVLSSKTSPSLILAEIIFFMLNLSFGLVFNYPLYFGATDTFGQIDLIDVVLLTGHTIPQNLDVTYTNFPLFHIYFAQSTAILGLSVHQALFLISSLVFCLMLLFIYSIFLKSTGNIQVCLLTCLIYSCIPTIVTYGVYVVPRVMAYFGFLMFIFLLILYFFGNRKTETAVLLTIISVYIILVHQVSIAQFLPIFGVFLLAEWIVGHEKVTNLKFLLFIIIAFIGYWFFFAWDFFSQLLHGKFQVLFSDSVGAIKSTVQAANLQTYITQNWDTAILIFLLLTGIGYVIIRYREKYVSVYALVILFSLPLLIPNPLQIFWASMVEFRADRITLFLTPFEAFIMAFGLIALYWYLETRKISKSLIAILLVAILVIFAFFSVAWHNASDNPHFNFDQNKQYLDSAEVQALGFSLDKIPFGSRITSDSQLNAFFIPYRSGSKKLSIIPIMCQDNYLYIMVILITPVGILSGGTMSFIRMGSRSKPQPRVICFPLTQHHKMNRLLIKLSPFQI